MMPERQLIMLRTPNRAYRMCTSFVCGETASNLVSSSSKHVEHSNVTTITCKVILKHSNFYRMSANYTQRSVGI